MGEADADKKAEKPERPQQPGGGTAQGLNVECQTPTACDDNVEDGVPRLMEEALRYENLTAAYKRVKRNGGAPGIDGMTVDELLPHCQKHWERIREQLLTGKYVPQPVRRVEIPKPTGKGKRTLGIPTVLDRLIQQALLKVLHPIFDPTFSDGSFGFRPGRSTHDAVVRAHEHIVAGHRWVVDLDLEKFFDRINHDVLMARVARRVKDKRVLRLIRRYLQAGIMEGGVVSPRLQGSPQGGPLSPILSNILLDELDGELERRGHRFVRYADDVNVYVRSRKAGERVLTSLEEFLRKRLRLEINRDKSAVDHPWNRTFLGYSVTDHEEPRLKVAPQSIKRLRSKLKPLWRRGRGRRLAHTIADLTPIIRGWTAYFRLAGVQKHFGQLDQWIRRKLRCIVWRQWKRPRTRFRKLRALGVNAYHARLAMNNHGPWWQARARHMNIAIPNATLRKLGLISFLDEHRRLARSS